MNFLAAPSAQLRERSFFFQAEDGIRDDLVTGVQTCALPISPVNEIRPTHTGDVPISIRRKARNGKPAAETSAAASLPSSSREAGPAIANPSRSEERRVGKECRAGWGGDPQKNEVGKDREAGW